MSSNSADRIQGVVAFSQPTTDPAVLELRRIVQAVLHRVTSVAEVVLLLDDGGVTFTNAATTPGTSDTKTQTVVDCVDAGIDQVRVVVRGKNSTAGSVTVQVYDTTDSVSLGDVTVTGTSEQTGTSAWATITPTDGDHAVEVRVIGDGAMDPVLYSVRLQGRTLQARA